MPTAHTRAAPDVARVPAGALATSPLPLSGCAVVARKTVGGLVWQTLAIVCQILPECRPSRVGGHNRGGQHRGPVGPTPCGDAARRGARGGGCRLDGLARTLRPRPPPRADPADTP